MQKLKTLLLIIFLTAGLSCKKSSTTTTLQITVIDGAAGTPSAFAAVVLYAAAADVPGGSPKYTVTADQSGKVKLTVNYLPQYFVLALNGSKKNYYNGFIPVGVFKTQADIQDSPAQNPPAIVGSIKFRDTNGDGVITAADVVAAPSVSITPNTDNSFSTTIY